MPCLVHRTILPAWEVVLSKLWYIVSDVSVLMLYTTTSIRLCLFDNYCSVERPLLSTPHVLTLP